MSEAWDQVVDRHHAVFKRHGLDPHAVDFSAATPAAIEAMAQALLAMEREPQWPPHLREWAMQLVTAARTANPDDYRGAAGHVWEDELRLAILRRVGPPPGK